jgi:hypothetical protein
MIYAWLFVMSSSQICNFVGIIAYHNHVFVLTDLPKKPIDMYCNMNRKSVQIQNAKCEYHLKIP